MYIVVKYTFKINYVVTYHNIGSTCDPAGILILVLLMSNTQIFYDKQFILKLYGSLYFEKRGKVYEYDTSITRINEKIKNK